VAEQARQTPCVDKDSAIVAADAAVGDGSCQAAQRFGGVDGVQEDAFALGRVEQSVARLAGQDAVTWPDLIIPQA
jgi:hypothetical protein